MDHESRFRKFLTGCHSTTELDFAATWARPSDKLISPQAATNCPRHGMRSRVRFTAGPNMVIPGHSA